MTAPYNRLVPVPLSADTPLEIERLQVEGWRRMTPAEKAATVTALTTAAINMTMAGIRHRFPGEPPACHRFRLAEILLGSELARRAFPDPGTR